MRLAEAIFFYRKFVGACGPPKDSLFEMVAYFDAFLFTLVSIEEMVSGSQKNALNSIDVFKFAKAARNVTTHHSVLAAPNQPIGFDRSLYREIFEEQDMAFAKLYVSVGYMTNVFNQAATKFPKASAGFQGGSAYLSQIQMGRFEISSFMKDVLNEVKNLIGSNLVI